MTPTEMHIAELRAKIARLEAMLGVARTSIKDYLDCSGDKANDERLGWLKEALAQLEGKAE